MIAQGSRSRGFLVRAPGQTKHERCSGNRGTCQNIFSLGTLEQGTSPTNAHIRPCNDPTMPGLLLQGARPGVGACSTWWLCSCPNLVRGTPQVGQAACGADYSWGKNSSLRAVWGSQIMTIGLLWTNSGKSSGTLWGGSRSSIPLSHLKLRKQRLGSLRWTLPSPKLKLFLLSGKLLSLYALGGWHLPWIPEVYRCCRVVLVETPLQHQLVVVFQLKGITLFSLSGKFYARLLERRI